MNTPSTKLVLLVGAGLLAGLADTASGAAAAGVAAPQAVAASEVAGRRAAVMERLADGILLLHARSEAKAEDQPGFVQDPSFAYFTGLTELPGAILALDGPRRQARLFVAPPPLSFVRPAAG